MPKVTIKGNPGPNLQALSELNDGAWFILEGVPMMKVGYQDHPEADITIEFRESGLTTSTWPRQTQVIAIEAPVIAIEAPDEVVLRWKK